MDRYPLFIHKFANATKGLTLVERAIYRELLDEYYKREGPLPLDKRERYRLAGASTFAERAAVDYIVGKYFEEQSDGFHQHRADAEIANYRMRYAKAQAAALAKHYGANAPRVRTRAPSTARPMRMQCSSDANAMRAQSPSNAQPMLGLCSDDARALPISTVISNNGAVTGTGDARADWMRDAESVVAKGKSVGIEARPGEAWQELRARILRALAARKARPAEAPSGET